MKLFIYKIIVACFIVLSCNSSSKTNDKAIQIYYRANDKAIRNRQIQDKDTFYLHQFFRALDKHPDSAMSYALKFNKLVNNGYKFYSPPRLSSDSDLFPNMTKEAKMKKIQVLKEQFIFIKDSLSDIGFYYHKTHGNKWPDQSTILCYLNSKGVIYLVSNYHAKDWLSHKSIEISIDKMLFQTDWVGVDTERNKTKSNETGIWENITYLNSISAIEAIAKNQDATVNVRFLGNGYYDYVILTARDKKVFKDGYELSNLLVHLEDNP